MENTHNALYSGPSTQPNIVIQPLDKNVLNDEYSIKLKTSYLSEPSGIIRMVLIVSQLVGLISVACVTKVGVTLPSDYSVTRDAYLAFAIIGFAFTVAFFILGLLNIYNIGVMRKVPWDLIILALDVLWLIPMFILGIVCSVKEVNVDTNYGNKGAFGAAAFLGFLTALLYTLDAGYNLVKVVRRLANSK